MRWFRWIMTLALLACLAPLASLALAGAVAGAHGCRLHEGFVNPCVIGGADWGGTLYAMGMMGWLMITTLPVAAAIALVWIAVELVRWVRALRARGSS